MAQEIPVALSNASIGALGSTPEEVARTLRALLVASFALVDGLSTRPARIGEGLTQLGPRADSEFASPERAELARTLLGPWVPLYWGAFKVGPLPGQPGGPAIVPVVATADGAPAMHELPPGLAQNVAFGWPAAVCVIVGIAGAVVLSAYVADKCTEASVRNEVTRQDAYVTIQKHAALATATVAHLDAEAKAGKPIPLNDLEKSLIGDVQRSTEAWATRIQKELPSIFPDLKPTGPKLVDTVSGWGNLAIIAIAAVAAFVLTRK